MKADKAIRQIQNILYLLYDGYGEEIHPAEQLAMIAEVLKRVKKEKADV